MWNNLEDTNLLIRCFGIQIILFASRHFAPRPSNFEIRLLCMARSSDFNRTFGMKKVALRSNIPLDGQTAGFEPIVIAEMSGFWSNWIVSSA